MSIPSNFRNAQHTTIGDHANLQAVAGDLTITTNNNNNYYHSSEGGLITINGRTIRRVIDGDIILRRLLSSKVLSINIKPEGASTSTELQVFKVKKTVQTARLHGRRGKFTATTFELIDEKDRDEFVKLVKNVVEVAICRRSTLLTQMFAVAESNALTLIAHDELANEQELNGRYGNNWIVAYYLNYACALTIESLRDDESVVFPVTSRFEDWLFNVESLTWQYDPASVLLNPPSEDHLTLSFNPPTPLRQETLPRLLNTAEIVACFETSFGDVLHLLAPYGGRWLCDLSNFAQHRLLTFGAVLSYNKRGILAYLPSIPSPEWFCKSGSPDVKASFSSSVPWRVDLAFRKTGHTQVTLKFSWRIPEKHRNRLRCAYLCQSLSFYTDSDDVGHVFFIDEIGFYLEGAFHDDPTTHSTPAYLFIPPLPTEVINNTHRIRYPLPKNLFYWSHDPQGRTAVVEEDWKKFGIPKLSVQGWIGSSWEEHLHAHVQDHLQSGDYELNGKRYARDHGYPELIHADPRDNAIEEHICSNDSDSESSDSRLKTLNSDSEYSGSDHQVSPSHSLPHPSPSSPAEASTKCDTEHEDAKPAQPGSHWAKPVFVKWYNSVLATLAEADGLDHSVVAC
ncbi:hypothetical protein PQX77_019266 [Marasmius sp. AFHP31]|nr:hypothetical protein PQX77_019266 [Marasmius sp. AFHP31]